MGDFCHTQRGEVTRKGGLKEKLKPALSRGLETSGTQTWETEKNPLLAPVQYGLESLRVAPYWCLALLATYWIHMRMCPTHGGWWKQNMESAVGRENDVMFLFFKHVQSV